MSRLALLLLHILLILPSTAVAQTKTLSEYEQARLDLDRIGAPGGENADAFFAAKKRAEALEDQGAWEDALEQWEEAFVSVKKAVAGAEFGTTPMTMGLPPNQFTIQMPRGFNHQTKVRDRAAQAAHRAGNAKAAMHWADGDKAAIAAFEVSARAGGREDLADQYRVALLRKELDTLDANLTLLRARTDKRVTLLGVYDLMLLLIAGALVLRHVQRRPRFTYFQLGLHSRSIPEPPFDWRPTIAAAVGGVFGLAVVAWLLFATQENAHRTSGVVLLLVSVLATGAVLWVFTIAITRTPRALRRVPRTLQDLDPVQTDALVELRAWFDANVRELCADFGVGRFARGRLDRTVPAVSDPMLRGAVAAWLGGQLARRSSDIPAWLDEHVGANLNVHPAGAWEPLVAPYVAAISPARRHALLHEIPAGVAPVFGAEVTDPAHLGPVGQWLEFAMVGGRRWPASRWLARFDQIELAHLVASVVWAAYDGEELVRSFRFDAEGGLMALGYETLDARDLRGTQIGVAHVVDFEPGDRLAWEQELADFESVALFDQLGRPPSHPPWRRHEPGARFDVDIELPDGGFDRLLDAGWERCSVGLHRMFRPFGLTVQVHIDAEMHCRAVSFFVGYFAAYQGGTTVEPDRVSDVAISEVLYELQQVGDDRWPHS